MWHQHASDGLARCGTFFTRHGPLLATPAPLIYTRRGGALYLTPDLLARLRDGAFSRGGGGGGGGGGEGGNSGSGNNGVAPTQTSTTCMLGLVTTQFLDQPSPELLAAVATASKRSAIKKADDESSSKNNATTANAGAAWAGLQGWPSFALNRDPLAYEYGPPAGGRPATNAGTYVSVSSGHTLADLRVWMAAVRSMAPDCFVGLADEVPSSSGGGGGGGEEGEAMLLSHEEVLRAVDKAEEREAEARRLKRRGRGEGDEEQEQRQQQQQGAAAPARPKATKPPRLVFPPGVDARVARSVERTAWWMDRCLEELGDEDDSDVEASSATAAKAAKADRDRGMPAPFEARRGGGDFDAASGEEEQAAPNTTTPLRIQYFAPVVGSASPAARLVSAREAARRDGPRVAGYALCGFGTGESSAQRVALLRAALDPLPADKPRLMSALLDGGPLDVLDAVAMGVDLFDCAWPTASSARGFALSFPVTREEADEAGVFDEDEDDVAAPTLQAADAPWATHPVTSAGAAKASAAAEALGGRRLKDGARLNLWAPGFRLDPRPLVPGCTCQACCPPATVALGHPPPSRAYVHHLLAVEEMVAAVLLDAHNEHHWLRFFAEVRRQVERGTLDEYREWLAGWLEGRRP